MTSKMLWVDKYRPTSLDSMDYHKPLSNQLKKMVESGNFPHLIVYGPSGAGKKTRIMALLKEIYGPSVLKLKVEHRSFKGTSKVLELMTVSSMYHIEMNPADVGNQDRLVVQEVIKEIAQSPPIDYGANKQKGFKVVVLNEVDKLSRDAQHALRRTMEKYISAFRLVMCCNSTSKVLEPVRSRCLAIRVPAPSAEDISSILQTIAKKEGFAVPGELAAHIADVSKGNLRRAILTLEAMKVKQQPLTVTSKVSQPDWEEFISTLAKEIVEEQSPKRLQLVRVKLYELITHCIPPELIIKKLTLELLKKLDSEVKYEVMKWAAFYEHRLQLGTKAIFHLEAFVAKFMSIYKRFLISAFG